MSEYMRLTVEKTKDYFGLLMNCYSSEPLWLEKYVRNAPTTLEDCVNMGVHDFSIAQNLEVYCLWDKKELVGYFGIEKYFNNVEYLHGFWIMPHYRNAETIKTFWKIVKSKTKKELSCALYAFNDRGIKFLKRRGFKEIAQFSKDQFPCVAFLLKK